MDLLFQRPILFWKQKSTPTRLHIVISQMKSLGKFLVKSYHVLQFCPKIKCLSLVLQKGFSNCKINKLLRLDKRYQKEHVSALPLKGKFAFKHDILTAKQIIGYAFLITTKKMSSENDGQRYFDSTWFGFFHKLLTLLFCYF